MIKSRIDHMLSPLAEYLQEGTMARLGIGTTMGVATRYNTFLRGDNLLRRRELFELELERLLEENGGLRGAVARIEDGYALDTSGELPHLGRMLMDSEEIIRERGGKESPDTRYRAFFRNLITPADLTRYPSLLDFITSSEVMAAASNYLGFIPRLSDTLPPGVRFAESSKAMDAESHLPHRDSQLFHMDPYSTPMVYVIVLLRDVTPESGPFCWIRESVSQRAKDRLGYWKKGKPYRLSDEEVYSVVEESDRNVLCYPKGTVLFIDPSRCLHYGSRDAVVPRYQMMYGLVSPVRSDFSESFITGIRYPLADDASQLRRLVLDKHFLA